MISPIETERQARIAAITHSGVSAPMMSRPRLATASTAKPVRTVTRIVNPASSLGASAVDRPVISPCGAIARPAASAVRPCTDCTNTGSRNTATQVTTDASAQRPIASAGTRRRVSDKSRAGWSTRVAQPA